MVGNGKAPGVTADGSACPSDFSADGGADCCHMESSTMGVEHKLVVITLLELPAVKSFEQLPPLVLQGGQLPRGGRIKAQLPVDGALHAQTDAIASTGFTGRLGPYFYEFSPRLLRFEFPTLGVASCRVDMVLTAPGGTAHTACCLLLDDSGLGGIVFFSCHRFTAYASWLDGIAHR